MYQMESNKSQEDNISTLYSESNKATSNPRDSNFCIERRQNQAMKLHGSHYHAVALACLIYSYPCLWVLHCLIYNVLVCPNISQHPQCLDPLNSESTYTDPPYSDPPYSDPLYSDLPYPDPLI